jgi:hypothetical protein
MTARSALASRIARLRIDANAANPLPYLEAALAFDEAGEHGMGFDALEDVLELNPHLNEAYMLLIEQALALGQTAAARGYFAQGLDLMDDPAPLQERYGTTLATHSTLRVPLSADRPYLLASPVWGAPLGAGMTALLGAYLSAFQAGDRARLVLPAHPAEAQAAVASMQDALRGLAANPQGIPEITIQVTSARLAIRALTYRAGAVFVGEGTDTMMNALAEQLDRPRIDHVTPEILRRLFAEAAVVPPATP